MMAGPKGFVQQKKVVTKRLIQAVDGQEKDGKTTYALSAPGPIALINMDVGLEGVIEKWLPLKKIWVMNFDFRDSTNATEWDAVWTKVKNAWIAALEDKEIRSLVWDTATEGWELNRLARFGKLTQIRPHHYGPVNAEFRDLIKRAYKYDKNIILVHKLRDVYAMNKKSGQEERTGEKEMAGFKDVPYIVQAHVRSVREEDGTFGIKVINCRHNAQLKGEWLPEPMNDFAGVACEMVEGSTEADWS